MDIEQEMQRLQGIEEDYNKLIHSQPSLRDQFAMATLTGMFGLISNEDAKQRTSAEIRVAIAEGAYLTADAMLAQRIRP